MSSEVEALRRLLHATEAKPGGEPDRRRAVADRAGVSADNLYQVARGIPLPSGRPRQLGRDVKERLDAAFPGWVSDDTAAAESRLESLAIAPRLADALPVVLDAIAACTERAELERLLPLLVTGAPAYRQRVAELLSIAKPAASVGAPIAKEHEQSLRELAEDAERKHAEGSKQRRRTAGP